MLDRGNRKPYTPAVSAKDTNSTLDALVGAALRGLVEAGASAHAIGAFAVSYRAEAASILGVTESKPEVPDLQELVVSAVKQVLDEAGVTKKAKRDPAAKSVRFFVMVAGKKTSVTITPQEAEQLIKRKGGRVPATEHVQLLVDRAPANVRNRSLWVREQLRVGVLSLDDATQVRH